MTRTTVAGCAFGILLALAAGYWALNEYVLPAAATWIARAPSTTWATSETHPAPNTHEGFLYGRITTADADKYE